MDDEAAIRASTTRSVGNTLQEIGAVVRPEWSVSRAAIESCCGAADLADALLQAGAD
jgi:hypothetical protein